MENEEDIAHHRWKYLISDIESRAARESECWADAAPAMRRDEGHSPLARHNFPVMKSAAFTNVPNWSQNCLNSDNLKFKPCHNF